MSIIAFLFWVVEKFVLTLIIVFLFFIEFVELTVKSKIGIVDRIIWVKYLVSCTSREFS